jgi:hypothetical protein
LRQVPISWRGRRGVTGLTLALSHSATQRRGWTPPGSRWNSRDAIPGRVRVVACVLRCHGIKCPYGGRGADDVHAGAFERDGPRRGGVEPSSEADLARGGGGEPSSEVDPARGGVDLRAKRTSPEGLLRPRARRNSPEGASRPRTRRTLLVGASNPRARRTPPEGAFVVPPWRAAGATRVVIVSRVCFRFVGYSVIFVFLSFERVSPDYSGDPYGCPRQQHLQTSDFCRCTSGACGRRAAPYHRQWNCGGRRWTPEATSGIWGRS